jgi:hypothetical protein
MRIMKKQRPSSRHQLLVLGALVAFCMCAEAKDPNSKKGVHAPENALQCESKSGAQGESINLSFEQVTMTVESASAKEVAASCLALRGAVRFFMSQGHVPMKHIALRFDEQVLYPVQAMEDDESKEPSTPGQVRIVGKYDAQVDQTIMTKMDEPWLRSRPYFGLDFTDEIYTSVILHELVHAISKGFYRYETDPAVHAQDEYIAYVAQIKSLPAKVVMKMENTIGKKKSDFRNDTQINDFVHIMDPHGFGLLSFRHFNSPAGGKAFLEKIYSGKFRPPVMD